MAGKNWIAFAIILERQKKRVIQTKQNSFETTQKAIKEKNNKSLSLEPTKTIKIILWL